MGVVDDGNRHVGGNATGVVDGGVTGVAGLEGACIDDIAFLASRSERLRPAFFLIHTFHSYDVVHLLPRETKLDLMIKPRISSVYV